MPRPMCAASGFGVAPANSARSFSNGYGCSNCSLGFICRFREAPGPTARASACAPLLLDRRKLETRRRFPVGFAVLGDDGGENPTANEEPRGKPQVARREKLHEVV